MVKEKIILNEYMGYESKQPEEKAVCKIKSLRKPCIYYQFWQNMLSESINN